MQSGQRNGRQNSEPSICQCPRCASSFRSPENRRICHNSLGPLNIRRQRSEDQTDLRNTRSDRMYDSQQPGERRSYQQNQPRDGVCPRMVSELASPIRVPQQDSDCQTVRGSLRDSSEGRQFHAESVETEYSYSMRKCPTFYEPETGGTNISMCSGQPCRCDSTGQQTPLLTPRSDQQINPPTPHHILQNHTSYSDQSYRFPAHDNYTRKKDSVGNPSSPGIPKTQNSVGNPISPSKKSFGYFGCNRVNVIDCDKCRLESDSQQTGVLRIYSDPANTCRLHSDENSHRTISGLRNESECSDRNTSSLNRTDQREFEMNYQELPSNGPTEPKIFGSQHYERACDYGQTEPKVFGSQHYERACDYDQTELKVCRPKSYEKNCDRKVETKQRKSSDAEHYRKLSDGSSSIQQSIGRQCTCGSSKANSVPCAERVRTQSAANFCNPNENGIESFDKDSRQSMWSRCTCGASLANHISCMGNERSEEAKYISEGYLSFGENCQETPESEQAEIVYARTDTEGRYSWHGEKGESRQTISSRNSDSDPGPLSSMSSTSSRSSLDSDRPVVILTWSPGSDPVLDKRKKNHVEEIMFLGKKLKKKKIRVKTDRDNFRGRERREFLESSLPNVSIRSNRKIPVFSVTRPYLNLLVKPRIFSGFLKKNFFMYFERQNAFQNSLNYFSFPEKICVPTLPKISDLLPETHFFFFLA